MTKKEKKSITDVLSDAKEKIRDQLENTAKLSNVVKDQVEDKGKKIGGKVTEVAKDTKNLVKENADSVATLLSVMLVL